MTRYFFHIDNGGVLHPDAEGADFSSVAAMQNEALCSLKDVVRHGTLEHDRRSSVQVRDGKGTLIFSATMRVLVETSSSQVEQHAV